MSGFGSLSQPEEEYIITESLPDSIESPFLHPQSQTQTSEEEAILTTRSSSPI